MPDINEESRGHRNEPVRDDREESPPAEQADAREFYKRLEQTGQLVDVEADTDLARLPPSVTHIRKPDGTVERIGFSESAY